MSHVDPTGRSVVGATFSPLDLQPLDPASVLLALSAQQMGIMQNTLSLQITDGRSLLNRVGQLGSAAGTASRVADRTIAAETNAATDMLGELEKYRQQYQGGELSSLDVSPADNERLKELADWARDRGYDLGELTRLEYPPVPPQTAKTDADAKTEGVAADSAAGQESATSAEAAEETPPPPPPEPHLVLDLKAADQLLDALHGYVDRLASGNVDNPAIRERLASDPEFGALSGQLRQLGLDSSVDSVADVRAAQQNLEVLAAAAKKQLADVVSRIGVLAKHVGDQGQQLQGRLDTMGQLDDRIVEARADDQELNRQELSAQLRKDLEAAADAIDDAARTAAMFEIPAGVVNRLNDSLNEAERADLNRQLAAWKNSNDWLAATPAPSIQPSSQTHPSMRRNYM